MGSCVEDVFVCLEAPKTALYADIITGSGAKLYVAPGTDELNALVAAADIVQLEWWHHPVLAAWMNQWKTLLARLVVWVHISGLHYPAIPPDFACLPYACLLTSKVSLLQFEREHRTLPNICEVVNSSGGFDDLPMPKRVAQLQPRFGYLGSLNPAKLHPDIVTYLNAVDLPGFTVDFYGDASTNPQLRSWAQDAGPAGPLVLRGYTNNPGRALTGMDVLVYLLNPTHYGTTENALLEAMACGVVPVVLNNPVEEQIVENGLTGLIVDSPSSFADVIRYLSHNPEERLRLSSAAAAMVRERYSVRNTVEQLDALYLRVMDKPKRSFEFEHIFGNSPSDWFISCTGDYARHFLDESEICGREERLRHPFLYEKTKASALQFAEYFPADPRLAHWARMLERDLAQPS
jgi:glycosyltransferase involved in cell wall biosynthesis